jgi:hypothetical protein
VVNVLNVLLVYDTHHHVERILRKLDYNYYRVVDDEPANDDDYCSINEEDKRDDIPLIVEAIHFDSLQNKLAVVVHIVVVHMVVEKD